MNAQEIIERIRTAEKKTPVRVFLKAREPVEFPHATVFPCGETTLVFGDWKDIGPVLEEHKGDIQELVVENDSRNSAIPLLDKRTVNARIEPGAILREQVEIGDNAVIMMGAILNIGAVVGAGTMIDMGAVLGGRATVGKNCHIGAGTVLAGVIEPASAVPVVIEDDVVIGQRGGAGGLPGGQGRRGGRRCRGGQRRGPQHRGGRRPRPGAEGQGRKNCGENRPD